MNDFERGYSVGRIANGWDKAGEDNVLSELGPAVTADEPSKVFLAGYLFGRERKGVERKRIHFVDCKNKLLAGYRYQFDTNAWTSSGVFYTRALSSPPSMAKNNTLGYIRATYVPNGSYSTVRGYGSIAYYSNSMPLGKYRVSFYRAVIDPEPINSDKLEPRIGIYTGHETGGVSSSQYQIAPGERYITNIVTNDRCDGFSEKYQFAMEFWFSRFKTNGTITIDPNQRYQYTFYYGIERIEDD